MNQKIISKYILIRKKPNLINVKETHSAHYQKQIWFLMKKTESSTCFPIFSDETKKNHQIPFEMPIVFAKWQNFDSNCSIEFVKSKISQSKFYGNNLIIIISLDFVQILLWKPEFFLQNYLFKNETFCIKFKTKKKMVQYLML